MFSDSLIYFCVTKNIHVLTMTWAVEIVHLNGLFDDMRYRFSLHTSAFFLLYTYIEGYNENCD
jgi:hypothetical protein